MSVNVTEGCSAAVNAPFLFPVIVYIACFFVLGGFAAYLHTRDIDNVTGEMYSISHVMRYDGSRFSAITGVMLSLIYFCVCLPVDEPAFAVALSMSIVLCFVFLCNGEPSDTSDEELVTLHKVFALFYFLFIFSLSIFFLSKMWLIWQTELRVGIGGALAGLCIFALVLMVFSILHTGEDGETKWGSVTSFLEWVSAILFLVQIAIIPGSIRTH